MEVTAFYESTLKGSDSEEMVVKKRDVFINFAASRTRIMTFSTEDDLEGSKEAF